MARMAKSRMAMVSINPIKYQSRMKSKTLQDREAIYKLVFDNCFDGLAYCQMIFDSQGQPIDFVYKLVNKSFKILTGLESAVGKKVSKSFLRASFSNRCTSQV